MNILFSVHTLDECIDIPKCDSVYITYKVVNPINIIQRVSRCLRVYENKGKSGIFLWCNKYREIKLVYNLLEDFNINISQKISKENLTISNYLNKVIFDNDEIKKDILEQIEYKNEINLNNNELDLINFIKNKSPDIPDYLIEIICKNNLLFDIDIDNIVKLINQRKANIKRTLVKNFSKNVDYTLEKVIERGGKPKENIFLKLVTFKKLCIILNNKKTKLLYDYIFIIEENINRYKDNIIESLKIIN
jgi:hypothetical protein